ncbi:MAG: DNA polymerase IV [Alphaproteobacteria bacterium]|nr:DNA polymerase IV [Alphaproteobacteria bacterium]
MTAFCRDCLADAPSAQGRCQACGSPRLKAHAELDKLSLAHVDCDAFYCTVEKRDNPAIQHLPVIVGGGQRGVVSAACYVARTYGVRSAMPMFQALARCPDAVVIRPDMAKYAAVSRQVRELMLELTPLVEPLSLDEAFLDLAGTERLHHMPPAKALARLARRVEREIGVTLSVGLSYCKFLAKVASDLDKPRGFAVIGRAEAMDFLAQKPVGIIWGVGKTLGDKLAHDGIHRIADLQQRREIELMKRYGAIGRRLYRFARGEDDRTVEPHGPAKSISAETTFRHDLTSEAELAKELWALTETLARRLKRADLAAGGVVLKLKTADFRLLTRSRKLERPSQLADTLFRAGRDLLAAECDGTTFRLIGIGTGTPVAATTAEPDLLDPRAQAREGAERAIDALREKFGEGAIGKGRGFSKPSP